MMTYFKILLILVVCLKTYNSIKSKSLVNYSSLIFNLTVY